jgi:hypothetical protein
MHKHLTEHGTMKLPKWEYSGYGEKYL